MIVGSGRFKHRVNAEWANCQFGARLATTRPPAAVDGEPAVSLFLLFLQEIISER